MSDQYLRMQYSDDGLISELESAFVLNEMDGTLYWRQPGRGRRPGEAGCLTSDGYRLVRFKGRLEKVHRIVFALVHRRWPVGMVDHANMNKSDNRPENLREASYEQNSQNVGLLSTNTSGVKGVSWNKRLSKWHTYVEAYGKRRHLGFHADFELAELIANEAREKLHKEFARAA